MQQGTIARHLLITGGIAAVLWIAGAGRASAQPCVECPPPPPPPGVITCPPPVEGFATCIAMFTPENDSWTYFFDPNNSIKITTKVFEAFPLRVDRIFIDDGEYSTRVMFTPFSDSMCWHTFGASCNFYRVHGESVPRDSYGPLVEYIVGFTTPPIPDNKHDMMLLRAPCGEAALDPPCSGIEQFSEEITTKVRRNYGVGDDPGVGGDSDGFSDYIVAYQRIRPVARK